MKERRQDAEPLTFTKLEVNLIYGFRAIVQNKWDSWFSKRLLNGKPRRRAGWTPMYRYQGGPTAVLQYDEFAKGEKEEEQKRVLKAPAAWTDLEGRSCKPFSIEVSKFATLRRDGVGALTVTFSATANKEAPLDMCHLLAMMLSAPRTLCGITSDGKQGPESELARFDKEALLPGIVTPGLKSPLRRRLEGGQWSFSSAFVCFLEGMEQLLRDTGATLAWPIEEELELGDLTQAAASVEKKERQAERKEQKEEDRDESQVRILDTQVPYTCVFATLPFDVYESAFLEKDNDFGDKRAERQKYSKQIAAILGRWLVADNIPFASADYWEARGSLRDGAFRSLYMNSLVFTAFSGMASFSALPELKDNPGDRDFNFAAMRLPHEPTRQSILRCLEFSRTRWHHVISLNRDLDALIETILKSSGASQVLPLKNDLVSLRSQAALHFEDPLSYLWDATVGSEIAKFLHTSIIERLEESTIRKLKMLDRLIDDRLDVVRLQDFMEALRSRGPDVFPEENGK